MEELEKAIFTNMCMVYDGDMILVQDRVDEGWSGIGFPGGHVEPYESFVDSVIREVKEETGLDIKNPVLCGIKQFYPLNTDIRYIVLMYKTNEFSGTLRNSEEGKMLWINKNDISKYRIAETFDTMLEVFLSDELTENFYYRVNGEKHYINK